MKAKHKGIIIEWGILTIISFLFYDIIWIPTSEDFSFLQINPNRSLEKASCHFLMTAIRKIALYMLDS